MAHSSGRAYQSVLDGSIVELAVVKRDISSVSMRLARSQLSTCSCSATVPSLNINEAPPGV